MGESHTVSLMVDFTCLELYEPNFCCVVQAEICTGAVLHYASCLLVHWELSISCICVKLAFWELVWGRLSLPMSLCLPCAGNQERWYLCHCFVPVTIALERWLSGGQEDASLPCAAEGGQTARALKRQVWSGWREQARESPAEGRSWVLAEKGKEKTCFWASKLFWKGRYLQWTQMGLCRVFCSFVFWNKPVELLDWKQGGKKDRRCMDTMGKGNICWWLLFRQHFLMMHFVC